MVSNPVSARRAKLLASPSTWLELTRDVAWRVRPGRLPVAPPTWPVDRGLARGMRLSWPRTYENPRVAWIFEWVRDGFAQYMPVEQMDIPQREPGLVTFELAGRGQRHLIAFDYFDFTHVHEDVLERASVYFKMQHLEEGYGSDRVVPGGYVVSAPSVLRMLPRLRAWRDRRPPRYEVFGRFGLRYSAEIRSRAIALLGDQRSFEWQGGARMTMRSQYLRDLARSRIAIDLPGQGPLCHRLLDSLAIGTCVVGIRPKVRLPVPLETGVHLAWVRDDLEDLVDTCSDLLADETTRARLGAAARDYFDRFLHPSQLVDFYASTCLTRLIGAGTSPLQASDQ